MPDTPNNNNDLVNTNDPERFYVPFDLRFSRYANDCNFGKMRSDLLRLSPEHYRRAGRQADPRARIAECIGDWALWVRLEEATLAKRA